LKLVYRVLFNSRLILLSRRNYWALTWTPCPELLNSPKISWKNWISPYWTQITTCWNTQLLAQHYPLM